MNNSTNRKISIKMYRQFRIVDTETIVYCWTNGRFSNISIIDENEELTTRHSLKELEALLNEEFFVRCHRCVLVNMQYVKTYDPGCKKLILINDVDLKVSKLKGNLIRQYFEKHI